MRLPFKCWRPPALGLAAVVFCVTQVTAQSGPPAEKLQLCSACHGEDGNSKIEKIPSFADQPAFFILNQLFLMREGVHKVEAMASIVKDLKDDDLNTLSQHSEASDTWKRR
jgi:cytochrome c553